MQHIVTVIDDLSSGYKDNVCDSVNFLQGSILDESFLESVFVNNKIEYVFHFSCLHSAIFSSVISRHVSIVFSISQLSKRMMALPSILVIGRERNILLFFIL